MSRYGQILEAYTFDGESWITIWDLAEKRKFSLTEALGADFQAGQLIRYDRRPHGETFHMETIEASEVPDGLDVVLPPLVLAETNHPGPGF